MAIRYKRPNKIRTSNLVKPGDDSLGYGVQIIGADDLRYARAIGTDECLGFADNTSSKIFQCFDPYQGSFIVPCKPFWDGDDGVQHFLLLGYKAGTDHVLIQKLSNNNLRFDARYDGVPTTANLAVSSSNFPKGNFHHIVGRWNKNITLDGTNYTQIVLDAASVASSTTQLGTISAMNDIYVGQWIDQTVQFNGILYYAILNIALPSYLLFDDFADALSTIDSGASAYPGRNSGHPGYPDWTVNSGTWSAANGYLEKTATQGTEQYIYTSYSGTSDDIVLEYQFKRYANNANAHGLQLVNTTSGKRYYLWITNDGLECDLRKYDGTSHSTIINGTWTADDNWHNVRVERKTGGDFELFFDNTSVGTVSGDTTETTFDQIRVQNEALNSIDNLRIYRLADAWARDRLMMVEDLYNFSGTADQWDGRTLWVDENTLLVPKRCVDVNNVLPATNLDILSWPSLMPSNTDYDASRHNMVDDGNMEQSSVPGDSASPYDLVGTPTTNARGDSASPSPRSGTQSQHIVADAIDEGFEQLITGLSGGDDLLIGVDYIVNSGSVKVEILQNDSAETVIQTVTLTDTFWSEYRTCVEVPSGETSIKIRCASAAASDDFNIDKIICHKSLVDNGGFESWTAGDPDGWSDVGTPTVTQETTVVHSGSNSCKVVADAADEGISQALTGLGNDVWHTATFWIYRVSGTVRVRAYEPPGTISYQQLISDRVGSWEKYCVTFKASSSGTIQLDITSSGGAATFYVDDVSCVELDEASPDPDPVAAHGSDNTPVLGRRSLEAVGFLGEIK
jgi:hypothetical protein